MKRYIIILASIILVSITTTQAQHTFGVVGGYGSGSESIYPDVEAQGLYGLKTFGVSWRSYTAQRVVGCVGLDLLYLERGFSFSPYSLSVDSDERFYYTRHINTLMLPIVWQPHVYLFDHRVRVFIEAAATFSYDLSSTYDNDYQRVRDEMSGLEPTDDYSGDYDYRTERDNRFGYGIAGGGGIALLFGRIEIQSSVRYYLGLSDVLRNRNKYYDNTTDGYENPFYPSAIRSSLNNLMISFGINYHFGPEGYASWDTKRVKVKMKKEFDYKGKKN